MKLASMVPWAYNFIVKTPVLRRTMNRVVGFHPDRTMPTLSNKTLKSWFNSFKKTQKPHARKVYIFCDEFTNYNDVEVGQKLILLLDALGYQAEMINHFDSGRTYLSKGLIREAQKIALQNVAIFKDIITGNTPLIGIEPSAILTFRDEYLELVSDEILPSAKKIAENTFLFEEWLAKEIEKGHIKKELFTDKKQTIYLHGHCHQKALTSLTPSVKALSFPQNYIVEVINSGCCGMAGSFGYEKEHYDVSMKVGELVLFPAVRKAATTDIIAAAGTSCRHQIKDGTRTIAKHPAEVLFEALK